MKNNFSDTIKYYNLKPDFSQLKNSKSLKNYGKICVYFDTLYISAHYKPKKAFSLFDGSSKSFKSLQSAVKYYILFSESEKGVTFWIL